MSFTSSGYQLPVTAYLRILFTTHNTSDKITLSTIDVISGK